MMSSYALAEHESGDRYAVQLHESGRVLRVSGPIRTGNRNDTQLKGLVATTGSTERARWLALELALGRATIPPRQAESTARL